MNISSGSQSGLIGVQSADQTNNEKSQKRKMPERSVNESAPNKIVKKNIEVRYLPSNGNRKTLKSPEDGSAKFEAVKALADFECQVCLDVHEKILQTRCCEIVICASCYLSLPSPKKCPWPRDGADFKGIIKDDLKAAGRLIDNQIERLVANFDDVQSTATETEKTEDAKKSQAQNDAIRQLKSNFSQHAASSRAGSSTLSNPNNTGSTKLPTRENVSTAKLEGLGNIRSGANVTFSSQHSSFDSDSDSDSVSNMYYGGGMHMGGSSITINGRNIQGRNLVIHNGRVVSGEGITITNQPSRSNSVRTHDFVRDDVHSIDVYTSQGDIVIEGQNTDNQNKVSVISSKEPKLRSNTLSLDCGETVRLNLPEIFNGNVNLHTCMGSINTQNGYSVKSGGDIHTNMGSVNIMVDSLLVQVKGITNIGSTTIRTQNQNIDWERQKLLIRSNMGSINVYDEG